MISAARLDEWLRGLDPDTTARALLGLGIRRWELWSPTADVLAGRPHLVRWTLSDEDFDERVSADPREVAINVPSMQLRLAIETDAIPDEIVRRLLDTKPVASAFVAVRRPAGSLRRRPWRWPLRIALVGFPIGAEETVMAEFRGRHKYLRAMLTVQRVEDEPGAVDVVVVKGPLVDAVAQLVRLRPVANAVLVLDKPLDRSPIIDAHQATARAATGAIASALVPPVDVSRLLKELVKFASHAEPFDIALTEAAGSDVLLWAEPDALNRTAVPEIARQLAAEIGRANFALATPSLAGLADDVGDDDGLDFGDGEGDEFDPLSESLTSAAEGLFSLEHDEATRIVEITKQVEPTLAAFELEQERWCQAYVGGDNRLVNGCNQVRFFIGPLEVQALAPSSPLGEHDLPWEAEDADAFRLTILFIPVVARPTAQEAELELPRFGRSPDVMFNLDVPDGSIEVTARIVVLFRNRVLQTALLRGHVEMKAELTELTGVVPTLAGLDDRRMFDLALFANHVDGQRLLIGHTDRETRVGSGGGVPAAAQRIADLLAQVATRRSTKAGLRSNSTRKLLIELAVEGRDLLNELQDELGPIADASRIQVVSARPDWLLPIELVYGRPAPDENASICENYLADPQSCNGKCTPEDSTTVLCPNAFWGLSKTIERHRFDPSTDEDPGAGYVLLSLDGPKPGHRDIVVKRTRLGASRRVDQEDTEALVKAIGKGAAVVTSWEQWRRALASKDTQLLVLLPHTDSQKNVLEIAGEPLKRGRIEEPYVTGRRDVKPVVVLFGCRTGGTLGDPAGFAAVFMRKGASAVFHSSTDLLNVHATELARRLVLSLTRPGPRPQMLSDALTAFRRQAVREGLVAALAISALGDADWRI